jgi:hypothetical protein
MKHILILFILPFTLPVFGQNGATKKETVEWLKSRLDFNAQWEEKTYHRLELVKYDYTNDTLFYKVHHIYGGKPHTGYRIDAIPMRDINPDRIRIVTMIGNTGDMGLELYTINGKKSIQSYVGFERDVGKPMKLDYDMVTLYFPKSVISTQGVEITQRAANAVKHLIKLSGGTGEKF